MAAQQKDSAPARINSARATRFVSDIDIPSKPALLSEIDGLDDDITAIAKLVMKDLTLSAAVMKVVNSAWLALPNQIGRIEQAVILLGLSNVKNIIRAVCFRTVMEPIAEPQLMKRFWQSSLNTAVAASVIARYLHLCNPDEAYALGLFHNCGVAVLSSHYQNMDALVRRSYADKQGQILLTELESIHTDHASIGSRVAHNWNLPNSISDAIRDHHCLNQFRFESYSQTSSLIVCLKLAELLSMEYKQLGGADQAWEWQKIRPICCENAGLNDQDISELSQFVKEANCNN